MTADEPGASGHKDAFAAIIVRGIVHRKISSFVLTQLTQAIEAPSPLAPAKPVGEVRLPDHRPGEFLRRPNGSVDHGVLPAQGI
jgi:hypothetical protein